MRERLQICRDYLQQEKEHLAATHIQPGTGLLVCRERSRIMDALLQVIYRKTMEEYQNEHGPPPCSVSLLALGGFGRQEMCPHSDVDIMFLYPAKCNSPQVPEFQKYLADKILYLLWDLNLRVGHSTRGIKAALEESNKDPQTKNSLLEARWIDGSVELFEQFKEAFRRYLRKSDLGRYIRERLQDQVTRREKYGNTVFLQEPDIKQGVGGLREYQNIRWIITLRLDPTDLETVLQRNYLTLQEYHDFVAAYDFLLRVRTELHLQISRPSDLLDIERQPSVAWGLQYRQENVFRRVESFMKDYYRQAQIIHLTARYLEQRLAQESDTQPTFGVVIEARRHSVRQEVDGFYSLQGQLHADSREIFQQDPERLIRVFRLSQVLQLDLGFELRRLITENISLITTTVQHSPQANKAFRSILQEAGQVYPILRDMLECGVLSRFLPEFSTLECLVQHEYYHRYTADMHTLHTIRELDRIFNLEQRELTEKYHTALHRTETPNLLYLALLLHDIGKGASIEGHAQIGAEIASIILKRMGVNPELSGKIQTLIRLHLEMARFWQHYDLDDPRTAKAFAELVGDPDTLHYLFVQTFCDARGTAETLWNGYKDTLHTELYRLTLLELGDKATLPTDKSMIPLEQIKAKVPELSQDEIEAHYNLLPERYFIYNSLDEVVLHLRMVHKLLQQITESPSMGSLIPIVEWIDDLSVGMTIVHIVTWDRAGLFYKLAGAFSLAGMSIVSSKAISRADHISIDTFYLADPSGGIVIQKKAQETFHHFLESALLHNRDLLPEIETQARKISKAATYQRDQRLNAPIPHSVDVYHELSLKRTIIEIQTNDHIGLLYRVARTIYEHGFDITFARIATERHVAVDTFYIEPISPGKSEDMHQLIALREALHRIVASSSQTLSH